MHDIKTLVNLLKDEQKIRSQFFKDSKEDNMHTNLSILKFVSLASFVIIVLFINITPLILREWHITTEYIMFLPAVTIFFIFAIFYEGFEDKSITLVHIFCQGFCVVLFAFAILIDVFPYPNSTSTFMPLMLVVVPIIFTFRYKDTIPLTIISELVYVVLVLVYKSPSVKYSDILNSLVGLVFSVTVEIIVMRLRVADNSAKNKYRKLSTTDSLSGILNKFSCEDSIGEYLSKKPVGEACAMLIMDIDDFKTINDKLGHQVGDKVIEEAGRVLSGVFRATDIVGRIGGDEFMILVKNVSDEDIIQSKCTQIRETIKKRVAEKLMIDVSCSIGAAIETSTNMSFEELYSIADDALYEAKAIGKSRHVIYRAEKPVAADDKKVLLIADDSMENRAILSAIFKNEYTIVEAANGQETLSALGTYRDCLAAVLLDLLMPEPSGYQILQYMKSLDGFCRIPVLVITADGDGEEKALALGADDLVLKPVDKAVVRLRLEKVLKRYR